MLRPGPIDVHAHYLPSSVVDLCLTGELGPRVTTIDDGRVVMVDGYRMVRNERRENDAAMGRLEEMDREGIAVQVLSPNPIFFHYWDEPRRALRVAQTINDGVSSAVQRFPDRLLGLATLPLQDVDLALRELERAIDTLGLIGVEIGTNVDGRDLDDPAFEPFFAEVARRGVPIQIHPTPHSAAGQERMGRYHLRNLVGNLVETSLALGSLIFGGVLDRHPGLRIELAHGGGLVPYQIGRWDHGFAVRPEARDRLGHEPSELLRRCWFDTIVYSEQALAYLVEAVGPDRVVLGTDYPADMADTEGVARVQRVMTDPGTVDRVLFENARDWLKLTEPAHDQTAGVAS